MNLSELRNLAWPLQEDLFRNLLNEKAPRASEDLHTAVQHQVFAGGKRLRACLPLAAAVKLRNESSSLEQVTQLRDCPDWTQSALILGLSLELLHSGTLAHDDVMDGDTVRRNKPTVWVKHGIPQAINTGDDLFYLAQEVISKSPLSLPSQMSAMRWETRAMQQVSHGQALEIWLRREKILPKLSTYNSVVVGKTGGLFGLGLVFGGLAADLSTDKLESLYAIGLQLGALFQVQDDLVDLVGEKQRGGPNQDLWEGKPSWLVAFCSEQMDTESKARLKTDLYLSRDLKTETKVLALRHTLDEYQAIDAGIRELTTLQSKLLQAAEAISPSSRELVYDLTSLFLKPLEHLLSKRA